MFKPPKHRNPIAAIKSIKRALTHLEKNLITPAHFIALTTHYIEDQEKR